VRVPQECGEVVYRRGGVEDFLGKCGRRPTLLCVGPLRREPDCERLQRSAQFEQFELSLNRGSRHQHAPIGMDLDEPLAR
jgi:hypothetical protein